MDWESLYGSGARYEERLREAERERLADRVWARSQASRPRLGAKLFNWMQNWKVWTGLQRTFENQKLTMTTGDQEG